MKKVLKWVVHIAVFVAMCVGAVALGTHIGNQIREHRFFATLPAGSGFESKSTELTEHCPLCSQNEVNGPCIINLAAGTVQQISIYNTDRTNPKKIDANKTEYGTMSLLSFPGLGSGARVPDAHYASVSIQRENICSFSEDAARQFFCDDCVTKITALEPVSNVLFADCYHQGDTTLYRLEDAQKGVKIRHYTITIDELTEWHLHLKVSSSFFSGGSSLDD